MNRHFLDLYLMSPTHPITVSVVGCGGTGSYVVTQLAKIAVALYELNGTEMFCEVYDDDIVEEHNVGRQLFSPSDAGKHKSDVIIGRVNRFYGLNWISNPRRIENSPCGNIIITCVDNVKTRRIIKKIDTKIRYREYEEPIYWMDFGNSRDYGQYVLSTFRKVKQPGVDNTVDKLHDVFKLFGKMKEKKDEPSCSMAQSLNQQDLFINLQLATAGINLLWKLLKDHQITYQGQFINTGNGNSRAILI